jgi:ABC-type branched-subunit amino acid transport system substrate-binding protein
VSRCRNVRPAPALRPQLQIKFYLRSWLLFLALLLTMALAPSCTRQQNNSDRSTIQIGFFGDLTGPTFDFGLSAKNGMLMAADEINQAGGINGHL